MQIAMATETDYQKLEDIGKRIQVLEAEIDDKEMRWLALSEKG